MADTWIPKSNVITKNDVESAAEEHDVSCWDEYVDKLTKLSTREEQLEYAKKAPAHTDVWSFFSLPMSMESDHTAVMNKLLSLLDIPYDPELGHDYTKDVLHVIVTALWFDTPATKSEALKRMYNREINRHYESEPHHAEYEILTCKECKNTDIAHMALERLTLEMQFNRNRFGSVNLESMRKDIPNFYLGDTTWKQELYQKYISEFAHISQEVFRFMFMEKG